MLKWTILAAAMALAIGAAANAAAGGAPPASPSGLVLVLANNAWRLDWQDNASGDRGYVAHVSVRSDDGAEVNGYSLGTVPESYTYLALREPLGGVPVGRCYRAEFLVYALGEPDEILGEPGTLETQLCVGNDGRFSFPSLPVDNAPPPASASDVRVVANGRGGYTVTWRDNSQDETNFQVGIGVVRADGSGVGGFGLGMVPANRTSLDVALALLEIPTGECYDATIYVFAARGGNASGWPGNTTLPLCVEATRIVFPTAGSGPHAGHDAFPYAALAAIGVAMIFAGAGRRRARA
jgi:hypothetical protein